MSLMNVVIKVEGVHRQHLRLVDMVTLQLASELAG